jgi:hypothetical protein
MRRFFLAVCLCAALSPALVATSALAQESPAEGRSTEFRAVEGSEAEDVDGGALMVAAYGAILVLLLGYVLYLARLQAGTTAELARLKAAVEKQRGYRDKPALEPAKPAPEKAEPEKAEG